MTIQYTELKGYSKRRISWHDLISSRSSYHCSNARHPGRYYQSFFGFSCEHLDKLHYEPEVVDYISNNYCYRDQVTDIVEDFAKRGFVFECVGKNVYKHGNYTIYVEHMDITIKQLIPISNDVAFEEWYHTRHQEDAFEFVYQMETST